MKPHTVLVLCATHRDRRELALLENAEQYRFLFHDYASIELEEMVAPAPKSTKPRPVHEEIERIVAMASGEQIDAVVSTDDYPGTTLASIVAARLGLPGTPVAADLRCQHKYYSRLIQKRVQPDATPLFALLDSGILPELPFPFFIKPVKSFFSVGAYQIDNQEALQTLLPRATLPKEFFEPFNTMLERYADIPVSGSTVLAEALITGIQATFEGYAFKGHIYPIGVVDSLMFPGTLAFERFDYPSALPQTVQARIAKVAACIMRATGFTHGLFNIEFRYDAKHDRIGIIEINPRMASQFADLYEKVDGFNTYSLMLDLAQGRRPFVRSREGRYATASSCVLRRFEDAYVVQIPSEKNINKIRCIHPDVRIEVLANPERNLSQQMQDGYSFRYGVINLGGSSHDEVLKDFSWCSQHLEFVFR